METTFTSRSHHDTIRLGRVLGEALEAGCVVGLIGDLGAGKTCFVKGIAYGINRVPEHDVTSPTFTILQEYEGNVPLYHFDAYRLAGAEDLATVGFEDYIGGEGVSVIEWADRIQETLPNECLLIHIKFVNENQRRFICRASGKLHAGVLDKFRSGMGKSELCCRKLETFNCE
jgi:tRNA threonylcarbamoyladenosine biosynthesis protein TsaE